MNVTDKLYTEWAWRTKTGVPDINNPEDKAILNKLISELVKEEEQEPKTITKRDILDFIANADLDDKQVVKLYQRVTNFFNYRSIRDTIKSKGYGDKIYKQYSTQIQNIIEDLPAAESKKFSEYLQSNEKISFFDSETSSKNGPGLLETIAQTTGLSPTIIQAVFSHTGQDEKKRGVGMGELALVLLFDNVTNAASKGDLAIDGQEFEVKGHGAKLGSNARSYGNEKFFAAFEEFGATYARYKREQPYKLQDSADFVVDIVKDHGDKAIQVFNSILNSVGLNSLTKDSFKDPKSLVDAIGLEHFKAYQGAEGFTHFMVHDFGGSEKAPNMGKFIYVKGSADDMANGLKRNGVNFQKFTPTLFGPRIALFSGDVPNSYLQEDETE